MEPVEVDLEKSVELDTTVHGSTNYLVNLIDSGGEQILLEHNKDENSDHSNVSFVDIHYKTDSKSNQISTVALISGDCPRDMELIFDIEESRRMSSLKNVPGLGETGDLEIERPDNQTKIHELLEDTIMR